MKNVNLTCVECPLGCPISVEMENDEILSVKGNNCPRGRIYAESEVVCPMRVLTTTVKTDRGNLLPVKTNKPIKRADLFDAMRIINGVTAKTPIKIGEVIISNIYDGVDLIACATVK